MKKVAAMLVILLLLGIGWAHRRERPPAVHLAEFAKDRVLIRHGPSLAKDIPGLAEQLSSNLQEAEKITGARLDRLTVRLYEDYEQKGADVQDIYVAHTDGNEIFIIQNETIDGIRERLEFQLLMQKCCGKAHTPEIARAAAAALAGYWNQRELSDWQTFLLARGFAPLQGVSEYAKIPWTALFLEYLRSQHGMNAFVRYYQTGNPPEGSITAFTRSLPAPPPLQAKPFQPVFQKGISYAYENGYTEGYATKNSGESLRLLKSNGVEWIASIPYGFMRGPSATEVRFAGHSITTESDESLFALAEDARKRGMKVMLKPQLWISHAAWPGMVRFSDNASWDRWFLSYEDWILHYAIIAELTQADLFCIGTELVKTTTEHPERWRKLIARIRKVYSGPITYAANYGQEFEEIQFWDALDYIGLDNYYSVRSNTSEDVGVIKAGFAKQKERVKSVVLRFNKPLLFTEIGYHANPGAGMGSKEDEIEGYDENMQAACYSMALETYWNEPWFYGMYWWKWFSNPGDRGRKADIHSPHGRLAEKVLSHWYTQVKRADPAQ